MRIETKHQSFTAAARKAAAAIAATAAAACLFAACTADNDPGPDAAATGTPLIFTADVCAPPTGATTTRSATAAGQWTDGDVVAVEVDGVVKRYLASSSAGNAATLQPADADNTHYWPEPGKSVSVRAWYYGNAYFWNRLPSYWHLGASQETTPDDESNYQYKDFLYAPAQSLAYNPQQGAAGGRISLTFYHQVARVEVRIRKAGLVNDGNKEDILTPLGYNPSTNSDMCMYGTFDASLINPAAGQYSGLTADRTKYLAQVAPHEIPGTPPDGYARCYEALVIPQDMSGKHFISVRIPNAGGSFDNYHYIPGAGEADLRGGYTYTYDITVSEHGTLHVTAAPPITGWVDNDEGGSGTAVEEKATRIDLAAPPTINDDGLYLLTGRTNGVTLHIAGGNPTVIVRDLDLKNSCIRITGGTPVIRVEGTKNSIYGYLNPPIWLDGEDANVHVTGTGVTESGLDLGIGGGYPDAAIGTKGATYNKEDYRCGNIAISNLTLYASAIAANLSGWGGAAIGTGGGGGNRKCGDITITDAHVNARPGGGAASIGFGCAFYTADMTGTTYEMGRIILRNSTIESDIGKGANGIYPAHIGSGAVLAEHYTVGDIFIYTDKSGTEFFSTFNGGTQANNETIVGFPSLPGERGRLWTTQWTTADRYTKITWAIVPDLL